MPCAIIGVLGVITWTSSHRLDPYRPLAAENKTITIQVIALQWKWLFIYPEQHIATVNFVQFPINQPVKFLITSEGPMNSLQIPQLAGQIYAMAGMQTQLHLIANKIGDYRGFSANFSGDGFSEMKFIARVSSKTQFDQWVKGIQNTTEQLNMAEYRRLMKPSMREAIHYYSSAAPNLFNISIMKSMMPMNEDGTHIHTHTS
jgi:cytochrome o ubiquinol oxidase subunit 2